MVERFFFSIFNKYSFLFFIVGLSILLLVSDPLMGEEYYLETDKSVSPNTIYEDGCGVSPDKTTVTLTVTGAGDCPTGGLLDIMLIIDRSSTMLTNARIDSAKAAAKAFVDLFRNQDRVGLISFATDVILDKGLTYMNTTGKAELKAAIDSIRAEGWTNIGDAVRMANHELQDHGRENRAWVEILLSDGLPNRPLGLPNPPGPVGYAIMAADSARLMDIPLYTIGLALTIQEGVILLQSMADTTGAIYYDSPTPDELRDIFQEIGGEVLCQAGTDITVTEILRNIFSVDGVFTVSPISIDVNPVIGTTLRWTVDEIYVGDVWTVSFDIRSAETGALLPVDVAGSSKVTYTRNGDQLETPFPQAYVTVNPCQVPLLNCLKTDIFSGIDIPHAGDTLLYRVDVFNQGILPVTNLFYDDTPDPYSTLLVGSVSTTLGTVILGNNPGDNSVSVSLGTLSPAQEATINFQVVIDDPLPPGITFLSNQGFLSGTELDPVPSDDPDTPQLDDPTITYLTVGPILEATKTDHLFGDKDGNGLPSPGDTLKYDVEIINMGGATAHGVTFTDTLDPEVLLVVGSVSSSQGSVVIGNNPLDTLVYVYLESLEVGHSVAIEFLVTIRDPLPFGITQVSNQGIVRSIDSDDEPTDDPDTPQDDDPTITRSFSVLFKRGKTFEAALNSSYCPYYRAVNGPPGSPDLIQITTYTYDPGHDLYWCYPIEGLLYPGSHLYITYTFGQGTHVDSIFIHIPAKGSKNEERHPQYRAVGPKVGHWETRTEGEYDFYGYDWTVYDEVQEDDGLWRIISEIYTTDGGETQFLPDTSFVILDTEDPIYHLTYRKQSDGAPLPTIPHPTLGDIPVTTDQMVMITTTVNQTAPLEGNGRLWSWMDIFIFAPGEKVDIDGVPSYADQLSGVSRWVNDPPFADTLDYNYVWNVMEADLTCEGVATVRIKGRDTASNLVDIEDGAPNTGLYILIDTTPPESPKAANIVITDRGAVIGAPGAVGVDWFGLGLIVRIYDNPALILPLASFEAKSDGSFGFTLPFSPSAGSLLFLTASDRAGHESEATPVVVHYGVAALEAQKTVTVVGDFEANPGDTLLYEVTLFNCDDIMLTGVTFTDVPDVYTSLEVGSVTTTKGTITSGNTIGDTFVGVTVGTLTSGETVHISFPVRIDPALPEEVQHVSNQGIVLCAELPLTPTDDPTTPNPADATVVEVVPTVVTVTYHLYPGWNTLSVPVIPLNPNIWDLFPDAEDIWGYNGGYIPVGAVTPGQGYFILYNSETFINITGSAVDNYEKNLQYGWNFLGSIIEEVPVSTILNTDTGQPATESCLDPTAVYEYTNERYFFSTRIKPTKAYWVFGFADCPILVRSQFAKLTHLALKFGRETLWTAKLFLENEHGTRVLEFGVAEGAGPGYDPGLDLPRPPAIPGKDLLSASFINPYRIDLQKDIRNTSNLKWILDVISEKQLTLEWDMSQLPPDLTVVLLKEHEESIDMRTSTHLTIGEGHHQLRIQVHSLPETFQLLQNCPNPFNPTTTISYTVPTGSAPNTDRSPFISLRIYNLLGQEVRTLVDGEMKPGRYTVTWDGRDDFGREVSGGVYFYRLHTSRFSQTRRMVLLK